VERQPAASLAYFADAGPGCGPMELLDKERNARSREIGGGNRAEDESWSESLKIDVWVPLRAVHVAAGAHHSAIAGADGRMWTWGSLEGGRLGRGYHLEPSASATLRLNGQLDAVGKQDSAGRGTAGSPKWDGDGDEFLALSNGRGGGVGDGEHKEGE